MDYKKIENIISMILEHESDVFEKPQKDDWKCNQDGGIRI